ncbi:MAG: 2,3-bisphosphoglycerate-independent phosphoglycerate mutase [Thermoproteus sp.]|jgi:2,3-bisphosphoglycerate-independent phosphoglycerate mutase|uniref:2,3-bisphosphoglycerate-independent phosphoglycerate mutase n=1 Tax=Thermoproteus sp. CP80 TaxID=1650659 RepID=UPI0007499D4B|nr:2,3-bisphosphoglycerate-independent phosphoglycerate mutase [Thermoproteus sp. CP80]KUO85577.1 MAG: phosphoglycerate mutase [Thermoproteus sp. CIS_19]MDT7868579.1 2,3-bisphosphoglycerate-independent phosphoglycerate mutase [Thermoproteus sp.]MDT7881208.1 2,3-bisphosphoglycerate-independent phosphoglycerate mutase [Thermoproteus sp.]PLC61802.1 phosphoglycerate mutase [Thermoproteus sp. CP80]
MTSVLWVLFDGGGDRPRNGATPFFTALKPVIDRLASLGSCGVMDPISPGVRPGSDTSHLALFGYDPYRYYTGRGAFEALGAGLELRPGDVAFRTNLATVDARGVVVDRRAGRYVAPEEAREVEAAMAKIGEEVERRFGVAAIYRSTVEHRGVLVLRGAVSHRVSDTDPHKTGEPLRRSQPLDDSKEAKAAAEVVNYISEAFTAYSKDLEANRRRAARGEPLINAVLVRGGGYMPTVEPLRQRYNVKGAAIAGVALIRGVAKAVGMDLYSAEGLGGTKFDKFEEAVKLAVELLKRYDLVFLHVKGTDSASHDGDFRGKVDVIERLDAALRPYEAVLEENYVVVTSDHATPISVREHTGEPVPILLYGPDVVRDDVDKFSELTCWRGALGRIRGMDVMPTIASYLGLSEKFGE